MATEKSTLSALEEQVGPAAAAEDAQQILTEAPAEAAEPVTPAADPLPAETAPEAAADAAPETAAPVAEETEAANTEAAEAAEADEADETEPTDDELAALENEYADLSKSELLERFARELEESSVAALRRTTEAMKVAFYRIRRAEVETARREWIEQGGAEEEFVAPTDEAEVRLKELFREYRRRRDAFIAELDAEKEANLKIKLAIIDELKALVGSDETLNHTFTKFRELQARWKETGLVPQANVKDLWETYNLHVENFYNFIKINKELRDLDLKKNLERKTSLCEQAEALADEPSVVEAFHKLQKLHDEWRETGPVANEFKEPLWERFKEASSCINKRHQAYFEALKAEQVENLARKTALCEEAEALAAAEPASRKAWNKASEQLLDLQQRWKTVGFAPKKENNRIYERFREACNRFFERKRLYYADVKEGMEENLRLKQSLCEQAEALAASDDWKQTTDELIALQARWKETGPVSRRHSDAVWKRFRSACDKFFERKAAHFATVDDEYGANLEQKRALLDEMAAADPAEGGYELIRDFQRRWGEIGFVPIKQKEAIQKRYKAEIDRLFEALRGSERDRSMGRFKERLSAMKGGDDRRMQSERERLYNKVRQLEQEIALLENNIGFFSRSKNAEAMIAEVRAKIDRAREQMQTAIEKVKLIDRQGEEA